MYNISVPAFSEYLLNKLQEYEKLRGQRTSLDKFAEYLGVSRPLVSYWLKGTIPSLENVQLLAKKFGPEVYDVLDLPRPNGVTMLPITQAPVGAHRYRQLFTVPVNTAPKKETRS